jgi:hypothetical protein
MHRSALWILTAMGLLSGTFAAYVFILAVRAPDLMAMAAMVATGWVVLGGLALAILALAVVAVVTRPRK